MPSPCLQGWIDQPLVKRQPSLEAWLQGQEWAAGRKSGRRRSGKKGCRGSAHKGKASVAMEGAARYSGISIRISEGHGQDWGPGMVMGARVTLLSLVPSLSPRQ